MNPKEAAQTLIERLARTNPNLTKLRTIAVEVGKNQVTADYLWQDGQTNARLLALLILDLKAIDVPKLETLIADIESTVEQDQRQLSDWLIANVIMKKASLKNTAMQWMVAPSTIKQRVFWSIQARTIKTANHERNLQLLGTLESDMAGAHEMVQEVMNWCTAQIGIEDELLRGRCIQLGERLALYKEYPASKGCISPYLPIWIESMVGRKQM